MDVEDEKILEQWQELKKRKKVVNRITIAIIIMIDIIVLYKLKTISLFASMPILIIDLFIYVIAMVISSNGKKTTKLNNEYKEKMVNKMLSNFIDELDYIPKKGLPSEIYNEANYDRNYNRYYSDDYLEGKIKNQKIVMADLNVAREEVKRDKDGNLKTETITIFQGLFTKINLNKSINSNLKITRNHYLMNSTEKKLELESSEFEKKFEVYTDNPIIGMQMLTADIQEDILEIYNKYKSDFHILIYRNEMYILFETGRMFELFSTKYTPSEILKKYFEIMKFIYKIVEKILNTIEDTEI